MVGDVRAAIVFAVAFIGHDPELVLGFQRKDWPGVLCRQVLNTRCGRMLSTLPSYCDADDYDDDDDEDGDDIYAPTKTKECIEIDIQ